MLVVVCGCCTVTQTLYSDQILSRMISRATRAIWNAISHSDVVLKLQCLTRTPPGFSVICQMVGSLSVLQCAYFQCWSCDCITRDIRFTTLWNE